MAPTTTCQRILLLLLLAIARPASSQLFTPAPPPPVQAADGGGSAGFNVATSLLFVGVVIALFFLGFFSAYLRRCSEAATAAHRRRGGGGGGGGAVHASAAVAAAAAAAFAGSAGRRRGRAGLDVAAMEALPVLTYATARAVKAGRGALECAVCLAEFADGGEKLRLLPGCCHVFHAACIDVWLAAHVTCPVCRADLADPAVAAAGHVLAADLAAQAEAPNHTVVNVDTPESTIGKDSPSDQQPPESLTAEERVDRYTLRLPERLKREIEEAKLLRRSVSAVTSAAAASSGRWASAASRTMSAARPSRRWSALLRALSGPRCSDMDGGGGGGRRVAPLQTHGATGTSHGEGEDVEVVVVQGDAGTDVEKYYAHSLTFAGFVIDGDVAAGDWNPEVFQVSTAVPAAAGATAMKCNSY
ncbi:E3 ubiquitin-protein ligase Os03g0188200-like [Oryza glaberrima]|uniref:E3 ubiquitin-protein ligase Os03g0188200-like n=1 Tax=Oryza glaberrima TaxID=4538 RepID=UPI00224C0572|nr:E3 ubiquitin-protein ligase Os03g0188200-like [Oryza glaberrima]